MVPLAPQLEAPEGKEPEPGASIFAPKTLLPYMKRLPVKRVVHVANATEDPVRAASRPCSCRLSCIRPV